MQMQMQMVFGVIEFCCSGFSPSLLPANHVIAHDSEFSIGINFG